MSLTEEEEIYINKLPEGALDKALSTVETVLTQHRNNGASKAAYENGTGHFTDIPDGDEKEEVYKATQALIADSKQAKAVTKELLIKIFVDTVKSSNIDINAERPNRNPKQIIFAGPYAVGKSSLMKQALGNEGDIQLSGTLKQHLDTMLADTDGHLLPIDLDAIREAHPVYQKLIKKHNPYASTAVRAHISALYWGMSTIASELRLDVVKNESLANAAGCSKEYYNAASEDGKYDLHVVANYAPLEVLQQRNEERGKETGRHIPEEQIINSFHDFNKARNVMIKHCKEVLTVDMGADKSAVPIMNHKDGVLTISSHTGVIGLNKLTNNTNPQLPSK